MRPVLEAIGVRKKFAGVVALHDLEITIGEGEIRGLVGANGAGKTTILNVIGGQLMADDGIVRVAGNNVERLLPWRRAELGVGRTFQEGRMWLDLTVVEHLRIAIDASRRAGDRTSKRNPLEAICSSVELPVTALKRTPAQLTLLDRRRVELAMAALNASYLLLVDEIGAGLSIGEARTLYRLISRLVEESRVRAAVVVEHKLELLAEFAASISLIEDGRVGCHADCKAASEVSRVMDRMFDRRSEVGAEVLRKESL